ncbi:MAG: propanediol utilization microcompartment protein PduB [Firmicutes bacterium]|nr:propanediol utilization microcompartment protein PduB [Bacillota bacterium]
MDDLIQKVIKRVEEDMAAANKTESAAANEAPKAVQLSPEDTSGIFADIGVTEYIGTTSLGPTVGLVLASIDSTLADRMELGNLRSIGFIGSRQGFCPQIMAIDEAVKATNVEVLKVEAPRDDMGGAGASSYVIIGGEDVADVRRCVEIALSQVEKYYGDVYANEFGHLDMQFTARASYCLNKAFGAPIGKAFGVVCSGPSAIGPVLADIAIKAANVEIVSYTSSTSGDGFSFANEVTTTFTGDSGAVRQAVKAAIEPGKKILAAMGSEPKSGSVPYI